MFDRGLFSPFCLRSAFSASQFVAMIRDAPETGIARHQLYRTLGVNFTLCPVPEEIRRSVLNEVGFPSPLAPMFGPLHPLRRVF